MSTTIISQSFVGLLYENGRYVETLNPGRHRFPSSWFRDIRREVHTVDMRERSITIKNQEILTADKVAVHVSLLVYFKVVNPVDALHNVASYEERIYSDVQLAARRYLASRALDAILQDRNEISDAVREAVRAAGESYGVEIIRADVKDLIFPGNLRDLMNQVLETERKAEAKVIEAKGEAEAEKIRAQAKADAETRRFQAEKDQVFLKTDVEKEALRMKLESDLEQAKLLKQYPEMVKLKQLDALRELARGGNGRFVLGLDTSDFSSVLNGE